MSEPGHAARTGRLGHGDFARRAGLAFADALHLRGTEGIELEAALALLLLERLPFDMGQVYPTCRK